MHHLSALFLICSEQVRSSERNKEISTNELPLVTISSTVSLPVASPAHCQAWVWQDALPVIQSCCLVTPLISYLYSPLLHPAERSNIAVRGHLSEQLADFQLGHLMHCAPVTSKLAACLKFSNSTPGIDTLAWNCLEAANNRITKSLPADSHIQRTPSDNKTMC